MKLITSLFLLAFASQIMAQGVPHTFTSGTPALAAEVNENFSSLDSRVASNSDNIESIQSGLDNWIGVLDVEVITNVNQCGYGDAHCTDFGFVNPRRGNDSPVRLIALVSRNGEPVTGLVFENFAFYSGFVGPGGSLVQFCTDDHQGDATCDGDHYDFFAEAAGGRGVYGMWLRPYNFRVWEDGLYAGTLTVNDGYGDGAALVSFIIY